MKTGGSFFSLPAPILLLLSTALAQQLPYNPTRIFLSPQNDRLAYVLQPASTGLQYSLSALDLSTAVKPSDLSLRTIYATLPFLSDTTNMPADVVMDAGGSLTLYTGSCTGSAQMYRYNTQGKAFATGSWVPQNETQSRATKPSPQFLSSSIAFSSNVTATPNSMSYYFFGGMCPTSSSSASTWQTNANYTNKMISFTPSVSSGSLSYEPALITAKNLPIAEAGQSLTALQPTYSNHSNGMSTQQQNFVFLGGHTQTAFINMSQVALWSLPQAAWTYFAVSSPNSNTRIDLTVRDAVTYVEPRSGHSAVLTSDGSKIIIFGGWIGDVNTPAFPQLAVLNVAESYGGSGGWTWATPSGSSSNGPASDSGIYGHGAVMLPGDIMLITGGYSIPASSSKARRATSTVNSKSYLFNVSSSTWLSEYNIPTVSNSSSSSSSGPLSKTSQQAGLGVGLGIGTVAVAGLLYFYIWYRRRNREREEQHGKATDDFAEKAETHTTDVWGLPLAAGQYAQIPSSGNPGKRPSQALPGMPLNQRGWKSTENSAERTGLLIENPSPTRGLRKNVSGRGPYAYEKRQSRNMEVIEERRDQEDMRSIAEARAENSDLQRRIAELLRDTPNLDPFIDATTPLTNYSLPEDASPEAIQSAREREEEVRGWLKEWEKAAGALLNGDENAQPEGRLSPFHMDRGHTLSMLSDASVYSQQSTSANTGVVAGIARQLSTRSAAFMNSFTASLAGTSTAEQSIADARNSLPSQRRRQRDSSVGPGSGSSPTRSPPNTAGSTLRNDNDSFSTARTSLVQGQAERESLLGNGRSRGKSEPSSPVKEKKNMGWYGSVKRAISGATRSSPVIIPPQEYFDNSLPPSPTKSWGEGQRVVPDRAASDASFLRFKRGARDWNIEGDEPDEIEVLQRPSAPDGDEEDGDDWDVERAAEGRVVQLMFTVPKQRLRVVNMDEREADGWSVRSKKSASSIRLLRENPAEGSGRE